MAEQTTVNGVRLFWELTGDTGEPLVLVHGAFIDHHNWDVLVPLLSPTFRVLTYDRRGHSQSERPLSQGSIEEDAADLAALIETLGLAPAHIAGSSTGALVVLRLAASRPDLFRSMIVHEPPLFDLLRGDPAYDAMLTAFGDGVDRVVELLEAGRYEEGVRQFVENLIFGPGAWEQIPPEVKQTVIFNAPTFLDERRDPEALSVDLARLRRFARPVLFTLGELSPPLFRGALEKLGEVLLHAEWKMFAGAGHEPEVEQADLYAAALIDFVERAGNLNPSLSARQGDLPPKT